MEKSNLSYNLSNGFVNNWLIAGPEMIPVKKITSFPQNQLEMGILKQNYSSDSGVSEIPVDMGSLKVADPNPNPISWRYYRCADDHFVDLTATYTTCNYLRAWAYVQVTFPEAAALDLVMTTNGPADLWLNGQHVHRHEHFSKQFPISVSFPANVQAGSNEFLIRFEIAAVRETPLVMALKISGEFSNEIKVIIPTDIKVDKLESRIGYEEMIQYAYLDRYVYGWFSGDRYDQNEPITVRFSNDLDYLEPIPLTYRLQSLNQDIFQEGNRPTNGGLVYELARSFPLRNGVFHLALMPPADQFYLLKIQVERRDLFYVIRTPYSQNLFGVLRDRRREALTEATIRRSESLYTEIAKMSLGKWDNLDRKVIFNTLERINQHQEDSVVDLMGFIGALSRFSRKPDFSDELKQAIQVAALNFRYWEDEPGEDIMDFKSENRQILFHACEILAGQLYPEKLFKHTGKNGKWHQEKGEGLAINWLNSRAAFGWKDWDANTGFAEEICALSHLVDFAASEKVTELASILMDKLLFSLAINSFQGAFGSTHGNSDTASILSSRLEATSGLSRLMWGMGNYNEHLPGLVSLACMKNYDFPNLIKSIATRKPDAFWDRERHGMPAEESNSANSKEVNKVTYKTRDYMLSSAQAYNPGQKGHAEHIWQATLGPDAVVFTNHPACFSQDDAHQPNFWRGNAVLPRVAQWGDVLVAQYQLPAEDWLGFTHAYFPLSTFDEAKLEEHWAFARKDKGYLALYSSCGFDLVTKGQSAYRELRAFGNQVVWFCQMGQELLDGSFEDFQRKILDLDLAIDGLSIRVRTLRGEEVTFGADSPLKINGQVQEITGFRHYESPYGIAEYPAAQLDIGLEGRGLRLKFEV